MGTEMGPSYANLFVGYIEHHFFNQYNGPKPELYRTSLRWPIHIINPVDKTKFSFRFDFTDGDCSAESKLKETWEENEVVF